MTRFVVLWLVPVVAAAWVLRWLLVTLLRTRAPAAAEFVERWWAWVPLVAVIVFLTFLHPLLGLLALVGASLFLASSHAVGSPFHPRH